MGSNSSSLSQDLLDEYSQLTYLHRVEILQIFKRFRSIDPTGVRTSLDYRIIGDEIMNEFHEIKCNPYADRLIDVFSSYDDGHLSFEDMLDLFSALSKNCPPAVKARWVFKILDFDEDNKLSEFDLTTMVERLCGERYDGRRRLSAEDSYRSLTPEEKKEIAQKSRRPVRGRRLTARLRPSTKRRGPSSRACTRSTTTRGPREATTTTTPRRRTTTRTPRSSHSGAATTTGAPGGRSA